MGWRTERWEARKRSSAARSFVTIKHQAAQAHMQTLLSAHGVAVLEHPLCVNAKREQFGHDTLWRSNNLFGDGPSYDLLISYGYSPLCISDVCCATADGVITSAFEVIAFAPPNSAKQALLRTLNFPVYSIDANAALALTSACPWLALAFGTDRRIPLGWPFTCLNEKSALTRRFAELRLPLGKPPQRCCPIQALRRITSTKLPCRKLPCQ